MSTNIQSGTSFPLGATLEQHGTRSRGVNFSVYAHHAERVELLLFHHADDAAPAQVIALDPKRNLTFQYWHVFVPDLEAGQLYAYRAHGAFAPDVGARFDGDKVLFDPYGRALAMPKNYDRGAAARPGDNAAAALKSVVVDLNQYEWEGDRPLQRPFSKTVIYEMHLAGFTRHPNSGVDAAKRGTFAGMMDKIPYLQDLGITAVELLPVFQFDPYAAPSDKINYWGYQPLSFFAPHAQYSSRPDPLAALDEFRDLVKALHRAGIEVILDVVFNHTAEGGADGPTLCYRGLANDAYYLLAPDGDGRLQYVDYTGCGNTLNGNQTIVRRIILDSLRYWVSEMHVDGFRFDLASILSRDENGVPLQNPPVLLDIESDPVLAGTKLIAEAWDAAGLYQVGTFVGERWKEWNGKFRDDVRRFVKSDEGMVRRLAERLIGSPDIYAHEMREPEHSINFITCHDGFTLNDLVSYNTKHNEANGEGNRDGTNDNWSWNCGVEGATDDAAIETLRARQVKNFFALTLLAVGTPMLLMGDEVRRTQQGNNNAYCQDNELSWFDWTRRERYGDLYRFVQMLIAQRLRVLEADVEDTEPLNTLLQRAHVEWHGTKLNQPDWSDASHSLAYTAYAAEGQQMMHVMINAYWEPLEFELPRAVTWKLWLDTFRAAPDDIHMRHTAPAVNASSYPVQPRSLVALLGSGADGAGQK
jgi:isoamylase